MSDTATKSVAFEIGQRIRAVRIEKNLTQQEVGDALGLGRAGIANIESGRYLITLKTLLKLPGVLHYPVTYFLGVDSELSGDELKMLATYRSLQKQSTEIKTTIALAA